MHCIYSYLEIALYSGRPLSPIESDMLMYTKQMEDYAQVTTLSGAQCSYQAVMNFRGTGASHNTTILTGDVMIEHEMLLHFEETQDLVMMATVNRMKIFLACYFGEHDVGAELAVNWGDRAVQLLPGHPVNIVVRFANALSCFAMARKTGQRKYKKQARRFQRIIKKWSEKGNPNCTHYNVFLDAEGAALKGKKNTANKYYEAAMLLAGRRGLIQDQALANERYAEFHLENNEEEAARYRLGEAIKLYTEWGACRKVDQLENRYSYILNPSQAEEIIFESAGLEKVKGKQKRLPNVLRKVLWKAAS
jgi:hypothetical protein